MTAIDLNSLLAAADLADATDRAMLADAYEEAGRPEDAEALRADAGELADVPNFRTEVCQVTGYTRPDEFGRRMSYEGRKTVETEFWYHHESGCSSGWAKLHPANRVWWRDALAALHSAEVKVQNQQPHVRDYIAEARRDWDYDLDQRASYLLDLIEEARENAEEDEEEEEEDF